MLPQIRDWLSEINALNSRIQETAECFAPRINAGEDLGGLEVSQQFRDVTRVHSVLREFHEREIQLKDLQRGLLDEREIFLCWEHSEDNITQWHDLESGFAGRQPLWL